MRKPKTADHILFREKESDEPPITTALHISGELDGKLSATASLGPMQPKPPKPPWKRAVDFLKCGPLVEWGLDKLAWIWEQIQPFLHGRHNYPKSPRNNSGSTQIEQGQGQVGTHATAPVH